MASVVPVYCNKYCYVSQMAVKVGGVGEFTRWFGVYALERHPSGSGSSFPSLSIQLSVVVAGEGGPKGREGGMDDSSK